MRNWVLGASHVQVKLQFPIQQEQLPMWLASMPLQGIQYHIRQVIPLMSHILSYSLYNSQLHPPSLFLIHHSTINTEHKGMWSLSVSPCQGHELTLSTAYTKYSIHPVQHTPSTAYPEYSIHWVQHTQCTAYTEYSKHQVQNPLKIGCIWFILTITTWFPKAASASGMPPYEIDCHQPSFQWELKCKVNLSHSHGCELTNVWTESKHSSCLPNDCLQIDCLQKLLQFTSIMASKCLSILTWLHPPTFRDHSLQVHLHPCLITAAKIAWLWPPIESPNSHNHGSLFISKFAPSQPPTSHDYGLQLHLQTRSIMPSKCITQLS